MNLSVPAINFALLSICIALFSAKAATAATSHAFEASLVEPISGSRRLLATSGYSYAKAGGSLQCTYGVSSCASGYSIYCCVQEEPGNTCTVGSSAACANPWPLKSCCKPAGATTTNNNNANNNYQYQQNQNQQEQNINWNVILTPLHQLGYYG